MLNYRLCTANDFNCGFKPVLIYSKPKAVIYVKKKRLITALFDHDYLHYSCCRHICQLAIVSQMMVLNHVPLK